MAKKRWCLIFITCIMANLPAQDSSVPDGLFAGIGIETMGYTRSGSSLGGSLSLGLDINRSFSLGQKTTFYSDLDTIRVLELLVFFRYYLPWLRWPTERDGPFVQVDMGAALSMERGYHVHNEVFPSFSGGGSIGWRFGFADMWYVEPAVRIAYPHIWGAGITAGVRLRSPRRNTEDQQAAGDTQSAISPEQMAEIMEQLSGMSGQIAAMSGQLSGVTQTVNHIHAEQAESRQTAERRQAAETEQAPVIEQAREAAAETDRQWRVLAFVNDEGADDHVLLVRGDDGRMRAQVPPVVFRADSADFSELNEAILDSNTNTFMRVARMLNDYPGLRLVIEGHANPASPEGARRVTEEPVLRRLSENRARRAADELVGWGVSRDRLSIAGMGTSAMLVPYDEVNSWKNHRVEFVITGENND